MKTVRTRSILTFAMAALIATGSAFAQDTIRQREVNQQDRIAQGVRTGQLTPRETVRAERTEARINHQVRADRRAHFGHLTGPERRRIYHEQNRASRRIYRERHNRAHAI